MATATMIVDDITADIGIKIWRAESAAHSANASADATNPTADRTPNTTDSASNSSAHAAQRAT